MNYRKLMKQRSRRWNRRGQASLYDPPYDKKPKKQRDDEVVKRKAERRERRKEKTRERREEVEAKQREKVKARWKSWSVATEAEKSERIREQPVAALERWEQRIRNGEHLNPKQRVRYNRLKRLLAEERSNHVRKSQLADEFRAYLSSESDNTETLDDR